MDSHNKSRQSDFALYKFCMIQCSWLRLCNTVDIGMMIANFCKLFRYGVKRDHYENFIDIRKFSEQLAMDFFSYIFTVYIETPAKNIPFLDDIGNEVTLYTCRSLNYYSSSPHNS